MHVNDCSQRRLCQPPFRQRPRLPRRQLFQRRLCQPPFLSPRRQRRPTSNSSGYSIPSGEPAKWRCRRVEQVHTARTPRNGKGHPPKVAAKQGRLGLPQFLYDQRNFGDPVTGPLGPQDQWRLLIARSRSADRPSGHRPDPVRIR